LMTPLGPSPSARDAHVMAFDSARARTVLFGGETLASSTPLNDTWEWDGVQWSNRTGSVRPFSWPPSGMVYDAARQRTVLVGSGTWEWDGANWSQRTNVGTVPGMPLVTHGLVYDPLRQRVVLYGGSDISGNALNVGTWEYDGR